MSNQTKPEPPKIVIAPEGCYEYLTAGKEYEVIEAIDCGKQYYFRLVDDDGEVISCIEYNCGHAGRQDWIIKEREVSHD